MNGSFGWGMWAQRDANENSIESQYFIFTCNLNESSIDNKLLFLKLITCN